MRVLITGATSFIGQTLARRLVGEGNVVHALLRPTSDRSRLAGAPGVAAHIHDGSASALASIVAEARPDLVFHLAGKYVREHKPADVADLIRDNILFGAMLLEAMRTASARRLVFAATAFQHMDAPGYRPLNLYAATKQGFEDLLAYYADAHGLAAVTLVLFDIYGSGDWRRRLIPAAMAALDTGEPMPVPAEDTPVDLIHVDDAAEAFVAAARLLMEREGEVAGRRFAVAPARRHGLFEVLAAIERTAGKPVPVKRSAWTPPARAATEPWKGPAVPGWRPKVTLEDGIRRAFAER